MNRVISKILLLVINSSFSVHNFKNDEKNKTCHDQQDSIVYMYVHSVLRLVKAVVIISTSS